MIMSSLSSDEEQLLLLSLNYCLLQKENMAGEPSDDGKRWVKIVTPQN